MGDGLPGSNILQQGAKCFHCYQLPHMGSACKMQPRHRAARPAGGLVDHDTGAQDMPTTGSSHYVCFDAC